MGTLLGFAAGVLGAPAITGVMGAVGVWGVAGVSGVANVAGITHATGFTSAQGVGHAAGAAGVGMWQVPQLGKIPLVEGMAPGSLKVVGEGVVMCVIFELWVVSCI